MFEFFKNFINRFKNKELARLNSGDAAKERLNLVLMQDRANVSADYIDLMRQDIIDDIKKYIDIDEKEIDLKLTNQIKNDGSNGIPALYANIPINRIKSGNNVQNNEIKIEIDNEKKNEIKKSVASVAQKKKKSVVKVEPKEKTIAESANVDKTDNGKETTKKKTAQKTAKESQPKAKSASTKEKAETSTTEVKKKATRKKIESTNTK